MFYYIALISIGYFLYQRGYITKYATPLTKYINTSIIIWCLHLSTITLSFLSLLTEPLFAGEMTPSLNLENLDNIDLEEPTRNFNFSKFATIASLVTSILTLSINYGKPPISNISQLFSGQIEDPSGYFQKVFSSGETANLFFCLILFSRYSGVISPPFLLPFILVILRRSIWYLSSPSATPGGKAFNILNSSCIKVKSIIIKGIGSDDRLLYMIAMMEIGIFGLYIFHLFSPFREILSLFLYLHFLRLRFASHVKISGYHRRIWTKFDLICCQFYTRFSILDQGVSILKKWFRGY